MVERGPEKAGVGGSIPSLGIQIPSHSVSVSHNRAQQIWRNEVNDVRGIQSTIGLSWLSSPFIKASSTR